MDKQSAAQAYREASVENAPPAKVTRLLFEGALRFIDRAAACDGKDPRAKFVHWIARTDAIVAELRLALDKSHAPEQGEQLERLYLFCEQRLAQALSERDAAPALEARRVLATLLDAWRRVEADVAGC